MQLSFLKRNTRESTELFWEVKEFSAVEARLVGLKPGPLAVLFYEGYRETRHFLALSADAAASGVLTVDAGAIQNISRSLRKVSSHEIAKVGRDVGFLPAAQALSRIEYPPLAARQGIEATVYVELTSTAAGSFGKSSF